jgi:3-oxoadipate enol-lactonase
LTDYLDRDGWKMGYDDTGGRDPVVVFCHALGADRSMWDSQIEVVKSERRVLRYDHRGHGDSSAPPGDYTMADLGGDVLALADHLGVDRFDFCGISMGGQIGQWLALNDPDRVGRLALANTGAKIGNEEGWNQRIAAVRDGGMGAIADVVLERFLSDGFRASHPEESERAREVLLAIDPAGYIGCCAAVRDSDFRGSASSIRSRTLLVGGRHDLSVPPEAQEWLAEAIPDSEVLILDAAHLSNVEQPQEFGAALLRHLSA